MDLSFNLEIDDWIAFQKDYLKQNKSVRMQKLIMASVFPIISIAYALLKENYNLLIIVAILSIVWVIIIPRLINFKILNNIKEDLGKPENKHILGKQEMEISSKGVIFKKGNSSSKMDWNKIVRLSSTTNYYFLYNSSVSAIIIPKEKINNVNELNTILNTNIEAYSA